MSVDELLTTEQVSKRIGKSQWAIRRAVDQMNPPIGRFGGKRVVPVDRVDELAAIIATFRPGPKGPRKAAAAAQEVTNGS
jgi:hypothetical protein